MRNLTLRLSILSLSSLAALTALACSSSSDDGSGDDTTTTTDAGGGNDATLVDSGDHDSGPGDGGVDAEVPCTATPCVRQVATGGAMSCALLDDHSIRCWGANTFGELGSGTLDAGKVVDPATKIPPIAVPGITDAVAFAGTGLYSAGQLDSMCAVLADGSVKCWGDDTWGQLATDTISPIVTAVGPTTANLIHTVSIAGGSAHLCALSDAGGISCWGSNIFDETGHHDADGGTAEPHPTPVDVGAGVSFKQVAAGYESSCGVTTDGHVWCWGFNTFGGLGRATTDGGPQDRAPGLVAGLDDVKQVATGYAATCAVTNAGVIKCFGLDSLGILGRNEPFDASTPQSAAPTPAPVVAPPGITFTQVVPTLYGFTALASDGTVYSWGYDAFGQLGRGALDDAGKVVASATTAPTKIDGLSGVTQIAGQAYGTHSCARIQDGSVKCWGNDALSQVGVAPVDAGIPQFAPVTVTF